nr:hypothetical protein [Legionella jordanis]
MKLNLQSLEAICGDSKQVVVYGFNVFQYHELCQAINESSDIKAFNSDTYEYKNSFSDKRQKYQINRHFKELINDLVLENYKRIQKGEAIVPLIFVVGLNNKKLVIAKVAEREDPYEKGVTQAELRRCFKIAHEFGERFSEVAKQTFKFVELTGDENGYELKTVPPFWQDKLWQELWRERKESTVTDDASGNKNLFWRENYKKLIDDSTEESKDDQIKKQPQ